MVGNYTVTASAPSASTPGGIITATLAVQFTPDDAANYQRVDSSVTIDVAKARQAIAWATPAPIVYGTPLSAVQLNANVADHRYVGEHRQSAG